MSLQDKPKEKFYRYHPETGQDAEDFSDVPIIYRTPENDAELAAARRNGATFWWSDFGHPGQIHRCERINVEFVLRVTGVDAEWIDEKPVKN